MQEIKALVRKYMSKGMLRDRVLFLCGITHHQFYYTPKKGKPGRKKTKTCKKMVQGVEQVVKNIEVIKEAKAVLSQPHIDYGYRKMTAYLMYLGFIINHKKVYRLMKKAKLLQPKREKEAKMYARYRILCPEGPLRLIEMDIKQITIDGTGQKCYLLTLIDVFTRVALHFRLGLSMKQDAVQDAVRAVIEDHLEVHQIFGWELHIEIRSDNGPQFCATKLREFMKENHLCQTFTHPYTPEENGHVESFHSILAKALEGQWFADKAALDKWLESFYATYNYTRIHGSIAMLPPMTFWDLWEKGLIERLMVNEKKKQVRFKLKIPRYEVSLIQEGELAGMQEPEGSFVA